MIEIQRVDEVLDDFTAVSVGSRLLEIRFVRDRQFRIVSELLFKRYLAVKMKCHSKLLNTFTCLHKFEANIIVAKLFVCTFSSLMNKM
jgi:hypothetical protein